MRDWSPSNSPSGKFPRSTGTGSRDPAFKIPGRPRKSLKSNPTGYSIGYKTGAIAANLFCLSVEPILDIAIMRRNVVFSPTIRHGPFVAGGSEIVSSMVKWDIPRFRVSADTAITRLINTIEKLHCCVNADTFSNPICDRRSQTMGIWGIEQGTRSATAPPGCLYCLMDYAFAWCSISPDLPCIRTTPMAGNPGRHVASSQERKFANCSRGVIAMVFSCPEF